MVSRVAFPFPTRVRVRVRARIAAAAAENSGIGPCRCLDFKPQASSRKPLGGRAGNPISKIRNFARIKVQKIPNSEFRIPNSAMGVPIMQK